MPSPLHYFEATFTSGHLRRTFFHLGGGDHVILTSRQYKHGALDSRDVGVPTWMGSEVPTCLCIRLRLCRQDQMLDEWCAERVGAVCERGDAGAADGGRDGEVAGGFEDCC